MAIEQTLQSMLYSGAAFPREQLQELMAQPEEAKPLLLQAMEELRSDYRQALSAETKPEFGYAIYVLAQFRETKLFPILIDLLNIPADDSEALFGDTVTEGMGRALATIYDGDVDALKRVIENEAANEYARGQALIAMTMLTLHGRLERDEVIAYYKRLLTVKRSEDSFYLNAEVVQCCNALYPEEVVPEIRNLLGEQFMESIIISTDDIAKTLERDKADVLAASLNDSQYWFVTDAVNEAENWYAIKYGSRPSRKYKYNPAVRVVKIGRNDPCTCGSGKKYKKCCGAAG